MDIDISELLIFELGWKPLYSLDWVLRNSWLVGLEFIIDMTIIICMDYEIGITIGFDMIIVNIGLKDCEAR